MGTLSDCLPSGWHVAAALDNALPAMLGADWTGVRYARIFLRSDREREVQLGIPATCPRKIWLNGRPLHESRQRGPLRPNYDGDKTSYADATLTQGWNDVLIKYARDAKCPSFVAHFILTTTGLHAGIHDVAWTM